MPSLTMSEARARAALLTVDSYELDVDLTGAAGAVDTFRTTTTVRFRTTRPGATTFVELRPTTLRSARLNGAWLDPSALAGGRLPLADLASENELVVEADYRYSRASEGHAPVRRPGRRGGLRVRPAGHRPGAGLHGLLRPARPQGSGDAAGGRGPPVAGVRQRGAATQTGDGRWQFAPTPPLPPTSSRWWRARSTPYTASTTGSRSACSPAPRSRSTWTREAEELFAVTAACLDRYHELFGIRYPFDKLRPGVRARSSAGARWSSPAA